MSEFPVYERRVQFHETDMAGVVHFSRILTYVEEAEHDALNGIGVSVMDGRGGFPKVRVEVNYRSPLKFGECFGVGMRLVEVGGRSLTWGFVIRAEERLVAEGRVVTVLVSDGGASERIPDGWREKLDGYVRTVGEDGGG